MRYLFYQCMECMLSRLGWGHICWGEGVSGGWGLEQMCTLGAAAAHQDQLSPQSTVYL